MDVTEYGICQYNKKALCSFTNNDGELKQQWISVDDRLPEREHQNVLVCRNVGCVSGTSANFYNGKFNVVDFRGSGMTEFIDPTHWMPFPEIIEV